MLAGNAKCKMSVAKEAQNFTWPPQGALGIDGTETDAKCFVISSGVLPPSEKMFDFRHCRVLVYYITLSSISFHGPERTHFSLYMGSEMLVNSHKK